MATNKNQSLLQCTGCEEKLNLDSKTFPCLHSFCHSCLDSHFEGQMDGNGECPECHEPLTLDQLSLSPFLVKFFRCQQLESTHWECDLCLEDEIESVAKYWCHECQKLFCTNCHRIHKKFQKKHNARDLDGMERSEAIKVITTDLCYLHQEVKDCYCERCNMCFCEACYQNHYADSPGCLSQPLSVREEALKQKSQGSTMAKEMDDLEINLRGLNERTRNHTEELNSDCESKCKQLWQNFEEIMDSAKRQTEELCEEMRKITSEQVESWRHLLEENEKILKQLEIWRLNLHHLLSESQQDTDVVCGLQLLGTKLSSQQNKSVGPEVNCQLTITFPNWWLQVSEHLKSEKIASVSWTGGILPSNNLDELPSNNLDELPANNLDELPANNLDELPAAKNLVFDKQWSVNRLNLKVISIQVSKEDNHVFLSDENDKSIIGFTEGGEFICECPLENEHVVFTPFDMCLNPPDSLVVTSMYYDRNCLIFLERREIPPFLKIKKIIDKKGIYFNSLCQINESIIASCSDGNIYSITNEGDNRDIFRRRLGNISLIRADPSTGNCWVKCMNSDIICLSSYGEKIQSMKIDEEITDFCVNEFGFYFCNHKGIFSFSPLKILFEFEEKLEIGPKIFVLEDKIYVSLRVAGKNFINIFRILD